MFKTRLLSGIVLVAILIAVVFPGGWITWGADLLISLIAVFELYRVFQIEKKLPAYLGYIALIATYLNLRFRFASDSMFLLIMFLLALLFAYVLTYPTYDVTDIMKVFFGVCYAGFMLSYIYQTRSLNRGLFDTWLIFLSAWGCDTCAYCSGMLFGKHKLAPVLSPKKSVEGAIGGVLGSALLGALYGVALHRFFGFELSRAGAYALICGLGAIFSQLGDLSASAIKRHYEIKDYGTLIPGHGGIMDRFDSVIVTAPMIYYLSLLFVTH